MKNQLLAIVPGTFTIHRLAANAQIPEDVGTVAPCWIARTPGELSIVCPSSIELDADDREPGWSCIRAVGPLEFSLTGVLAGLSGVLADAKIPLFALSTFETDYILVKTARLAEAMRALDAAGYPIER